MDYKEALAYISGVEFFGSKPGLSRIRELLEKLGDPQKGMRFIHIVTPFYLMICFNQIYAGALRGIGDATMPTVIMLISFVVFRQIYLAVTKALGAGFIAVALAYPVGWILCSTLLIIRYMRSPLNSKT